MPGPPARQPYHYAGRPTGRPASQPRACSSSAEAVCARVCVLDCATRTCATPIQHILYLSMGWYHEHDCEYEHFLFLVFFSPLRFCFPNSHRVALFFWCVQGFFLNRRRGAGKKSLSFAVCWVSCVGSCFFFFFSFRSFVRSFVPTFIMLVQILLSISNGSFLVNAGVLWNIVFIWWRVVDADCGFGTKRVNSISLICSGRHEVTLCVCMALWNVTVCGFRVFHCGCCCRWFWQRSFKWW